MKALAILAAASLALVGCDDASPEQQIARANYNNGKPMRIAEYGGLEVYQMRVTTLRGNTQTIFIVPNATTVFERSCGKACTERVVTGAPDVRAP